MLSDGWANWPDFSRISLQRMSMASIARSTSSLDLRVQESKKPGTSVNCLLARANGQVPPPREHHTFVPITGERVSVVSTDLKFFLFGGINEEKHYNDVYFLNSTSIFLLTWQLPR